MHVLILYANPVATSFGAALHQQAIEALRVSGHDIDDCDLYAEFFEPILTEQERIRYHDTQANREPIARYVDGLLASKRRPRLPGLE